MPNSGHSHRLFGPSFQSDAKRLTRIFQERRSTPLPHTSRRQYPKQPHVVGPVLCVTNAGSLQQRPPLNDMVFESTYHFLAAYLHVPITGTPSVLLVARFSVPPWNCPGTPMTRDAAQAIAANRSIVELQSMIASTASPCEVTNRLLLTNAFVRHCSLAKNKSCCCVTSQKV